MTYIKMEQLVRWQSNEYLKVSVYQYDKKKNTGFLDLLFNSITSYIRIRKDIDHKGKMITKLQ